VHSGAWNCHGCGAHGGAYDAALAIGHPPREAIDLMIAHGLTERRPRRDTWRARSSARARDTSRESAARVNAKAAGTTPPDTPPAPAADRGARPPADDTSGRQAGLSSLSLSGEHVRRCARALRDDAEFLARVCGERGWEPMTLRELSVGFDGDRITVPITDRHARLQGLLRLRVEDWQKPKVRTAYGTRLGLIPHPELVEGPVVLVEGASDMLAARSAGLPAIAVPGTHAWRGEWADMFCGREVTVVMDADCGGREAAARIARDLHRHGVRAAIVDLDPSRDDGYDLSDWLRAGNKPTSLPSGRALASNAHKQTVPGSHDPGPRAGAAAPTTRTAHATPLGVVTAPSLSLQGSIRCAAL